MTSYLQPRRSMPATLSSAGDQPLPSIVVYKTVTCGCCAGWVEHMRQAGFAVDVRDVPSNTELMQLKMDTGVPGDLTSCHTSLVDGYVIEGQVVIERDNTDAEMLEPGDAFVTDVIHNAINPGPEPARLVVAYVVEKGKPLAEPVR